MMWPHYNKSRSLKVDSASCASYTRQIADVRRVIENAESRLAWKLTGRQ
jgi:hypothetical protein